LKSPLLVIDIFRFPHTLRPGIILQLGRRESDDF